MTEGEQVLSAGGIAAAMIEVIKWIIRWIKKDPLYEFPVKFYVVMIPVFSFLAQIPMAYLGFGGYTFPTNWAEWGRQLGLVLLTALVSMVTHGLALKGFSTKVQTALIAK